MSTVNHRLRCHVLRTLLGSTHFVPGSPLPRHPGSRPPSRSCLVTNEMTCWYSHSYAPIVGRHAKLLRVRLRSEDCEQQSSVSFQTWPEPRHSARLNKRSDSAHRPIPAHDNRRGEDYADGLKVPYIVYTLISSPLLLFAHILFSHDLGPTALPFKFTQWRKRARRRKRISLASCMDLEMLAMKNTLCQH